MSVNWSQYTLEQLRAHATQTFREGGGSRPDVLLIEIDGQQAVLKDQSAADKTFALLIGPILNWRECKALKKLSNVSCVPDLLSKPTARSFLMTYHQSEQITKLERYQPEWPEFFEKLGAAIDEIHRAGVAHNDLRNPTNTLVTPNGEPILVDLVACFCRGQAWNLPNRWMFNKFSQVDLSAITKIKSKVAKELITDTDIVAEDIAGRPGMAIKGLGQLIRRISRRLFTK
ncbi:MAG: putative Ser/Thr protein kinase [Arenicella sp.]|jgi:predicted Ser/Thr protein kinase